MLGGPGSSKSTTAAWLFSELKRRHVSIELVTEFVKIFAYQGRKINKFDQVYLFGKQTNYEYRFLCNGVKHIVTDSPTSLSAIYAARYFPDIAEPLRKLNEEYEKDFPSLNIFLNRNDKPYDPAGRYQSYEEAKAIDLVIKEHFNQNEIKLFELDYEDRSGILNLVLENIDE